MYGKNLSDFPERIEAFRYALSDLSESEINAGFEWAVRHLPDFPTPFHIRDCAEIAVRENRQKLLEESLRNQRLIEDQTKNERFNSTDAATRKREFEEMCRKAFEKKGMDL